MSWTVLTVHLTKGLWIKNTSSYLKNSTQKQSIGTSHVIGFDNLCLLPPSKASFKSLKLAVTPDPGIMIWLKSKWTPTPTCCFIAKEATYSPSNLPASFSTCFIHKKCKGTFFFHTTGKTTTSQIDSRPVCASTKIISIVSNITFSSICDESVSSESKRHLWLLQCSSIYFLSPMQLYGNYITSQNGW